jgi:hypothetical protein
MYLYLNEEVTGSCGDWLYDKYHLINLGSIPEADPDREKARHQLQDIAEFWRFGGFLEERELEDQTTPDSRWEYNTVTSDWEETVITTHEQRMEQWWGKWR